MPHFIIPITSSGAVLDAYVGVSKARFDALTAVKQPTPEWQKVRALLDTGASVTCIDPSVLTALGIPPTGTTLINTPSTGKTPQTVNVYDVGISIPGATNPPFINGAVAVAETPLLEAQGFHVLIGRDILASCVFHYNGPAGHITVSY